MKIELDIETKRYNFLKKKIGEDKIKTVINELLENYIAQYVHQIYGQNKTLDQKLN